MWANSKFASVMTFKSHQCGIVEKVKNVIRETIDFGLVAKNPYIFDKILHFLTKMM